MPYSKCDYIHETNTLLHAISIHTLYMYKPSQHVEPRGSHNFNLQTCLTVYIQYPLREVAFEYRLCLPEAEREWLLLQDSDPCEWTASHHSAPGFRRGMT
jgi:hypothetical protein